MQPRTTLAYIRVSSRAQDHAAQRLAIERAAYARGDTVEDWRAEKRSGKTMQREELQRLLAESRAGALRGRRLYLYRLDRLTRTGIADTLAALDELRTNGVDVVSVADGFELSGPHAEIIVAVMAWAAKMERLAINERISAARDRIEAQGGRWGRPSRVDRATRERAVALKSDGKTIREIARALKVPRSTIARALRASESAAGNHIRKPPAPQAPGPPGDGRKLDARRRAQ